MVLGLMCFTGILLGCFAINYYRRAHLHYEKYAFKEMSVNMLTALFILIILGIVILFLNAIFNALKRRTSHFVFAFLLIFWVFVTMCFMGLIWREMRKR